MTGSEKIDNETAELIFSQFCEDWDIDIDDSDMDEDSKVDFQKYKKTIIRKIKEGSLIYDESDETFNYTLKKSLSDGTNGGNITIKRSSGASSIGMDKYKENESMHKTFAKMANMIDKPVQFISRMDDIDIKILQAVFILFLGS